MSYFDSKALPRCADELPRNTGPPNTTYLSSFRTRPFNLSGVPPPIQSLELGNVPGQLPLRSRTTTLQSPLNLYRQHTKKSYMTALRTFEHNGLLSPNYRIVLIGGTELNPIYEATCTIKFKNGQTLTKKNHSKSKIDARRKTAEAFVKALLELGISEQKTTAENLDLLNKNWSDLQEEIEDDRVPKITPYQHQEYNNKENVIHYLPLPSAQETVEKSPFFQRQEQRRNPPLTIGDRPENFFNYSQEEHQNNFQRIHNEGTNHNVQHPEHPAQLPLPFLTPTYGNLVELYPNFPAISAIPADNRKAFRGSNNEHLGAYTPRRGQILPVPADPFKPTLASLKASKSATSSSMTHDQPFPTRPSFANALLDQQLKKAYLENTSGNSGLGTRQKQEPEVVDVAKDSSIEAKAFNLEAPIQKSKDSSSLQPAVFRSRKNRHLSTNEKSKPLTLHDKTSNATSIEKDSQIGHPEVKEDEKAFDFVQSTEKNKQLVGEKDSTNHNPQTKYNTTKNAKDGGISTIKSNTISKRSKRKGLSSDRALPKNKELRVEKKPAFCEEEILDGDIFEFKPEEEEVTSVHKERSCSGIEKKGKTEKSNWGCISSILSRQKPIKKRALARRGRKRRIIHCAQDSLVESEFKPSNAAKMVTNARQKRLKTAQDPRFISRPQTRSMTAAQAHSGEKFNKHYSAK